MYLRASRNTGTSPLNLQLDAPSGRLARSVDIFRISPHLLPAGLIRLFRRKFIAAAAGVPFDVDRPDGKLKADSTWLFGDTSTGCRMT